MRPQYYADLYRRYQTYLRHFGPNRLYRIACGPNGADYEWTEVLMREAGRYLDGLSLHYYTVPGEWQHKGSATHFSEEAWFVTMQKAWRMDELISRHSAIMDGYDPEKRVGLIVDEWGTWYDVEPGTNPGFLYQQNTLRDALVAGLTLNIFNNHAGRVHMANLAQTVNVLQALILTEADRLVLTPTYHVFDLYQPHQDATLLATTFEGQGEYRHNGRSLPQISVSASRNVAGTIHVSLCNVDSRSPTQVTLTLDGHESIRQVSGRVLTADDRQTHNTFDRPDALKPAELQSVSFAGREVRLGLPPMSVTVVAVAS
jgi:alpha-N-arabinofuranosidase